MEKIKETISFMESLAPSQTAEIKRLFLSIEDNEEFLEEFMKSYEGSKKKFALSWEEEPSAKTRPYFSGIIYYRRILEQVNSSPMMSFQEKQQIKKELDKSLQYAAQLQSTEKFVAWASLQTKKLQETTDPEEAKES